MAEVVGLITSVGTLAEITLAVFTNLYRYYGDVKSAPKASAELRNELGVMLNVLEHLQGSLRNDTPSLQPYYNVLEDALSKLTRLVKDMDQHVSVEHMKGIGRLTWPFKKSENEELIERIGRYKSTITMALNKEQMDTLTDVTNTLKSTHLNTKQLRQDSENRMNEKVLEWLCPSTINPKDDQHRLRDKYVKYTGSWIFEHKAYKAWFDQKGSFLWLHGQSQVLTGIHANFTVGSGKSMLTAEIVQRLDNSRITGSGSNIAVVYFYCNFTDKQSPRYILGSLLKQMLSQCPASANCSTEVRHVTNFYEKHKAETFVAHTSLDYFSAHLLRISSLFEDVFIIIDGLDECQGQNREYVLEMFDSFSAPNMHILASSRPESDIQETFTDKPHVEMEKEAVMADIKSYIASRLEGERKLKKISRPLKDEIEQKLLEKCAGMFRWVECQLDSISYCISNAERRKAIDDLPEGLTQTYQRILETIAIVPTHKEYAMKIITWLLYAVRPLQVDELAIAAALKPGMIFDVDEKLDLDSISAICRSFVKVNEQARTPIVELAHFSVAEYFKCPKLLDGTTPNPDFIGEIDGHRLLALSCLSYLLSPPFDKGPCKTVDEFWKLFRTPFRYSREWWHAHAKVVEKDEMVYETVQLYLVAPAHGAWSQLTDYMKSRDKKFRPPSFRFLEGADGPPLKLLDCHLASPIHTAVEFGLNHVLQKLVRDGLDVNVKGAKWTYPLGIAIENGNTDAIQLLLAGHADIGLRLSSGRTFLHLATECRNKEAIKMLLAAGANVNLPDNGGFIAFFSLFRRMGYFRARSGPVAQDADIETIKLLFHESIISNDRLSNFALDDLSARNNTEAVKFFLASGAKHTGRWVFGRLCDAAISGNCQLIQALVDGGANIHSSDRLCRKPIHFAVANGQFEVFEYLSKLMYPSFISISKNIPPPSPNCTYLEHPDFWINPIERLVVLDPDDPVWHDMLGDLYLKSGKRAAALASFD